MRWLIEVLNEIHRALALWQWLKQQTLWRQGKTWMGLWLTAEKLRWVSEHVAVYSKWNGSFKILHDACSMIIFFIQVNNATARPKRGHLSGQPNRGSYHGTACCSKDIPVLEHDFPCMLHEKHYLCSKLSTLVAWRMRSVKNFTGLVMYNMTCRVRGTRTVVSWAKSCETIWKNM